MSKAKYFVYFNLHKNVFSVKYKGRSSPTCLIFTEKIVSSVLVPRAENVY